MRLLYLYPEEWTGRRAREVHTLSTCVALAESGVEVTLLTAGGMPEMRTHLREINDLAEVPGLHLAALSRSIGPIRSASIFAYHVRRWLRRQRPFDWAYIIHLKAAAMLLRARIPYAYEAHEIFAETPLHDATEQDALKELERQVLQEAALLIATSLPLAEALTSRYALSDDFTIVPNAGLPPLRQSVAAPDGPFVYCGSLAEWKGLDLVILGCRDAQVRLKIVGGTEDEWRKVGLELDTDGIAWQPRVSVLELPKALEGACAGLISTRPETPSGHYSCPMKLFDYARCGLPVLTTALPSLQSLDVGSWCTQIANPTRDAWAYELKNFRSNPSQGESARAWANAHTWTERANLLVRAFAGRDVRR